MSPTLTALVVLQQLDTAAESARRRLSEIPSAEQELDNRVAAAAAAAEASKASLTANQHARRELEKQVAQVDARLARFEEHKAAVKTNQEFTALLHEIGTAKADKDALEDQILILLEAADGIAADVKAAEAALVDAKRDGVSARNALGTERRHLDAELAKLGGERARAAADVAAPVLAKYDQLLKQRRMIAVAQINGEMCTACHVRLRPAIAQQVRRNDSILQCDSCQRILYYVAKVAS